MTQHEKILEILSDGNWKCTNLMYASYIADPRTRLVELKKKGYELEWRWCQTHSHRKSKEWHLVQKKSLGIALPPNHEIQRQVKLFSPQPVYD